MGEAILNVPHHWVFLIQTMDFLVMQWMVGGILLCCAFSVRSYNTKAWSGPFPSVWVKDRDKARLWCSFPAERKFRMTDFALNKGRYKRFQHRLGFFKKAWNRQSPERLFILSGKLLFQSRIMYHYWDLQTDFLKFISWSSSTTVVEQNFALHMDGPPCVSLFLIDV